ncbi:cbb3-type cytochrome oxidase subunit 3 [Inhella crocodyli]|uniref:CcoQ/FixQ family Cbb3-type cytochrome c oxidase assembly chaperone n=1 Tax=Inhella crocodyli TaxID=2499851 RepID=A0A3S2UAN8_9BURK|nr:cbb3-type cytochrome c oxidase subunit 3 [Inhella crocodyli]RVT83005.1 CcoQ/FixQ family Cbb3-type cytochrome c oxidase assembly chaperone [Inhella crocodyli]
MNWDLNTLRSAATLLGFVAFVLVVWRTWRPAEQSSHAQAAALPFTDDETTQQGAPRE